MSRGFGFVQMTILRALAMDSSTGFGCEYSHGAPAKGFSLTDLGRLPEMTTVHRTSIGRAVNRLEDEGFLISERHPLGHLPHRSSSHWPKYVCLTEHGYRFITRRIYDEALAELTAEIRNYTSSHLEGIEEVERAATVALKPLVEAVFDAIYLLGREPHGIHPIGIRERPDLYRWMLLLDRRCAFDWEIFMSLMEQ